MTVMHVVLIDKNRKKEEKENGQIAYTEKIDEIVSHNNTAIQHQPI